MCLEPESGSPTHTPPGRSGITVADVIRIGLPEYVLKHKLPPQHHKVLGAIIKCRTPEMGGQLFHCTLRKTPLDLSWLR